MHVLATQKVPFGDQDEPVDLGLSPGDVIVLSAADTELACLSRARQRLPQHLPSLRLGNFLALRHPYSVDLFVERMMDDARFVVLRLLGGKSYWPYGVEQIVMACERRNIPLAVLPGDGRHDGELAALSSVAREQYQRLWHYLQEGGIENAEQALRFVSSLLGHCTSFDEPTPLPKSGRLGPAKPADAVLIFYRALYQAGDLAVTEQLTNAFSKRGWCLQPIFVTSLKDDEVRHFLKVRLQEIAPRIILNMTGFAIADDDILRDFACPVLQLVPSSTDDELWRQSSFGLTPRDLAMHVALPEIDGRVLANIVSFKTQDQVADRHTEFRSTTYAPHNEGIDYTADLAARWMSLRQKPPRERRIAIVLANYPARDGRLANGVGLDVPASAINILQALKDSGYHVDSAPETGNEFIGQLAHGATNDLHSLAERPFRVGFSADDYRRHFEKFPQSLRVAIESQWGSIDSDPRLIDGTFRLSVLELGNIAVILQPARGYEIDPDGTYHDPDLVPPHGYLATYFWLRWSFGADAVVQLGKHGNLEWLPGKALGLGGGCWPRAILGPTPTIYPFIVNDPGEGSQAKRRSSAVIIDHLTPPLARAEGHGEFSLLERQLDEYAQAQILDPERAELLKREILDDSARLGLTRDLGLDDRDTETLGALDTHLCELKELQIRDGLHVLGDSPSHTLRENTLLALVRSPRGQDTGPTASLIRALARDLSLEFDPLDCELGETWQGSRPEELQAVSDDYWRTHGDTVERLEALALCLVSGSHQPEPHWQQTSSVLDHLHHVLAPRLDSSGEAEIANLLTALDGRAVPPGPSGAPTRGRPEVLPTGRNFYSVDTRSVPTPAAWRLGWASADRILETYLQTHGAWPQRIAMSAWGTANMRTGGDDIAQALALIGCRPIWDDKSGRVVGTEIIPAEILARPRVDVTFRISGFFRDAFPAQIELLDDAIRAVAALEEAPDMNPLAQAAKREREALVKSGLDEKRSQLIAQTRIFGSMPGSYGAGLQSLIEHGGWQGDAELAEAYVSWGAFAYGRALEGERQTEVFRSQIREIELVLHNQDNREHDLLDSDDYYQFAGGLAVSVRHLSGKQPEVFHNDHSRPESPKIRTLKHEIGMIVRGRAANPKWLRGVMRHGYKGAFEIAATVDYLFAFAATSGVVEDHHFEALFDAYLQDQDVVDFLRTNNSAALGDIVGRFDEAIERGLWQPRKNSVRNLLDHLGEKQ